MRKIKRDGVDCFGSSTKLAMTIVLGILVMIFAIWVYVYRLPVREFASRNDDYVTRVVDGDTLEINKGRKLRIIGIDALEMEKITDIRSQISDGKGECFAEEAKNRLKELVENKKVVLEKDVSERDKYDRLLRYVYVGEENISEVLMREGFVRLATYPPDTKYYGILKETEKIARENKVGLWGKCIK
jgi:micrococcal nuclease